MLVLLFSRAASRASTSSTYVAVAVAAPVDVDDLPAVGLEALADVLGEGDVGVVLDGDLVRVIDDGEVAQLLVPCERAGFVRDALHHVAVGREHPDVVVERALAALGVRVEQTALTALGEGHADPGGQARAEGSGRDLHAVGVVHLGVAGGEGTPGAQGLQVVELEAVPGQEELDVLREAGVPAGEHETVAAQPVRVGRVVGHHLLVEQVGRRGETHGRAGVPVADLLHGVSGEHPHGVDGAHVEVGPARVVRDRHRQGGGALPGSCGRGGACGGHGYMSPSRAARRR